MEFLFAKVLTRHLLWMVGIYLQMTSSFSHADFHATLTGTTDNADRWFSKSDGGLALLANLDYEHHSGFYAGTSVSNVDFEKADAVNAANVEIIPYAGWTYSLSERWRLDLQWSRYLYDGQVFGHEADYNEYYIFLHYKDLLSLRISGADDYYGVGLYVLDYALTGRYPITDALQFSATFGYSQTQAALGADYPYWQMGFSYAYKWITLSVRYMDSAETFINPETNETLHALYDPLVLDATAVFSISTGF